MTLLKNLGQQNSRLVEKPQLRLYMKRIPDGNKFVDVDSRKNWLEWVKLDFRNYIDVEAKLADTLEQLMASRPRYLPF
jgi:hypothetical protein